MTREKVLMLTVGVVVGLVAVTWLRTPSFKEIDLTLKTLKKGDAAPDFSLTSIFDGKRITLSEFRNSKYVLLYFWASWCPTCLETRPQLEAFRKNTPSDRLEVLAINIGDGDSIDSIKKLQMKYPLSVPVLFDEGSKVSRSYGVRGVPFFVLIDPEGKIVYQGNELPKDRPI
ncbi:MAG: TlpA family protein disulfide reductase [Syntrophobacterales bacterium]|nr:TlpA family protein disulfide reductase [Syntrophobacterales bacterium]